MRGLFALKRMKIITAVVSLALFAAPMLASAYSYAPQQNYGYQTQNYGYGYQNYGAYLNINPYVSNYQNQQYQYNPYQQYGYGGYGMGYSNYEYDMGGYGAQNNLYAGWTPPHYNCQYSGSYYTCY